MKRIGHDMIIIVAIYFLGTEKQGEFMAFFGLNLYFIKT